MFLWLVGCCFFFFFNFKPCPLPLVLLLCTTDSVYFTLPIRYLCTLTKACFGFYSPGWAVRVLSDFPCVSDAPKFLIIIMSHHWILSPASSCFSCTGEPTTECNRPDVSQQGWDEGKGPLPWPAGNALPNAAQDTAGHLWCKNTLPAHG